MKYKGVEYVTRDSSCKKRACFVPFSGNGIPTCRLYELGHCKRFEESKGKKTKSSKKKAAVDYDSGGINTPWAERPYQHSDW